MSEVKYSLNGKSFKDFGVYVSDSLGLVGLLESKNITQYDWAEYHGIAPNLRKPKFKERTIELKCFIRGEDWEELFNSFMEFVIGEFSKSGTQRLHVEPFGFKTLPYEVFMKDEVKPEKTFSTGEMFATFSLKFIEPNPIKKVLKTTLDTFKLSYEIDSETEIFFGDGTKQTGRGNVNLMKDYSAPSYENSGLSLVSVSAVNAEYFEVYSVPEKSNAYQFSVEVTLQTPKNIKLYVIGRKLDNTYEAISSIYEVLPGKNMISVIHELNMSDYGKFIYKILDTYGNEIPGIEYENPRIETTEIVGEWQDMLGKEKIIIIAGNIEDMKNLQTPAEIIW
ncbi:hypothetical protein [Chryseobacterium sp. SIMBA_028]|uniref:hypothetical protein n=1 Tax=Chryseobacterium sp. SIMBA_028 TaxID=3085771 RepID=UPI00397AB11D